jgi:PKD repeat protein
MRLRAGYWFPVLLWVAWLPSCGNGGGGSSLPSAEAFADPEVCDLPCEVVIDSGVPLSAEELTFTWDFGEGPVDGTTRAFHVFETAGTHTITVTVSDGSTTTSDAVTVLAEAQPSHVAMIGADGGAVSQGACTVTVPAGTVAESMSVEVTELPSMEPASERKLDAERFEALGSAFEVSMPLKSTTPVGLAVKDSLAVGLDPSELAWLVRSLGRPHPEADVLDSTVSPALLANYHLLPVTRVDADGTAHGDIYGHRRMQLVKMAAPLDVAREEAVAEKAVASPLVVTSFVHQPTKLSRDAYQTAVREGLNMAHAVFALGKGYLGPEAIVVSVTKLKPGTAGTVDVLDHDLIELSHEIVNAARVKKAVAHEYFHLVQNMHRNRASSLYYFKQDGWFAEGTASWAMDEVFDEIDGLDDYYYAPTEERFWKPLTALTDKASPTDTYKTVAFWKWAEAKKPGIIKAVLEDQFALTHTGGIGSKGPIENLIWVDFLTSFKTKWSDADFLEFVYNARYVKDYDKEETKPRELWSDDATHARLHGPKQVVPEADASMARRTSSAPSSTGDAEDNPTTVEFKLLPPLTAHVTKLASFDLTGALHVRFPKTSRALDARVAIVETGSGEFIEMDTVRDLSKEHDDVTFAFDPNKEAIVIVVDPEWTYPPSTTDTVGEWKAWVADRCGSLPSNVIDASDEEELFAALTSAPAGSAVKLPAGTFTPPIRTWPLPEDERVGTWDTQVLVRNVTLAGAGQGQTKLLMRGDEYGSVGLTTVGTVTLRDMTIDAGEFWGVTAIAAKDLILCNVEVETWGADGVQFSQWPDGGDGFVGIYDSSITFTGNERHTGMDLYCLEQSGNIGAEILNSRISGWYVGVSYINYSDQACTVSVATDCAGFSNNELANLMYTYCVPPDCTQFDEQCP